MSKDRHAQLEGSELCLSCGFCCKGIISNRAALKPQELEFAKDSGFHFFNASNGNYAFHLPFHMYQNNRCSIYLNRPDACKSYRCNLLKRLTKVDIDFEKSKLIVFQIKSLMDSINKRMINIEPTNEFRQKPAKFLDLYYKNPVICGDSNASFKDIESFYIIIHRYIEERAD